MTKQFQTTQYQITQLQDLQREAIKRRDGDVEFWAYQASSVLKQQQIEVIRENWRFIVIDWFSTDNAAERLNLVSKFGIVQTKQDEKGADKFVSQKHDVKPPINRAKELRFWTFWRDNATCVYCQVVLDKSNSQIDHVIPVSAWPAEFMFLQEDTSNLVASCKSCNLKKLNFLQLPEKPLLHIEIDTCLPNQSLNLGHKQICLNASDDDCKICGLPVIYVFCNVHGLVLMQLCKLSAMKKYLGHN